MLNETFSVIFKHRGLVRGLLKIAKNIVKILLESRKKHRQYVGFFFRFCEYFLPEKILHFKCRLRMQSFIIKDPKCIDQGVPCRQADRHANYFSNIDLFLYDNTFVQPRSTRRILLLSSPPWTAGAPIRQLDEHKYCINGTEKKNSKK